MNRDGDRKGVGVQKELTKSDRSYEDLVPVHN